jgi:hypothetical protein
MTEWGDRHCEPHWGEVIQSFLLKFVRRTAYVKTESSEASPPFISDKLSSMNGNQ